MVKGIKVKKPQTPSATDLSRSGYSLSKSACPIGSVMPPAKPSSTRAGRNRAKESLTAHRYEATAYARHAPMNTRLSPKRSDNHRAMGNAKASAIMKSVCAHVPKLG